MSTLIVFVIFGEALRFATEHRDAIALTLVAAIALTILTSVATASDRRRKQKEYQDEVARFGWSDDIHPLEFERRCAEAMRLAGWSVSLTKGSGDQGVDVLAEKKGTRVVIQCKRYQKAVGNRAVQEALSGRAFAKAQYAAVVTNSGYTPKARELARQTDVHLLHFTQLRNANQLFGFPDDPGTT